jgi:hypothetical protein
MNDLSLFLLDIVQNAIAVKATVIHARLEECHPDGVLLFQVADNGPGMTEEQVKRAVDPFYTTRTTRKVGLGLPFLKAAALQAGGTFELTSQQGVGTTVTATFDSQSIDLLPCGDVASSLLCIAVHPDVVDFTFEFHVKGHSFQFQLRDAREALEPLSLQTPIAQQLLHTYLSNNIPLFL